MAENVIAQDDGTAQPFKWQPIETAPKTDRNRVIYILIGDGVCLPDIVTWYHKRPARVEHGNYYHPVPEGWFKADQGRSRLCGKATMWMPIPPYHVTHPAPLSEVGE